MDRPAPPLPRRRTAAARPSVYIATAVLGLLTGAAAIFPAGAALLDLLRYVTAAGTRPAIWPADGLGLLASTLGWCLGIGALATLLAWPAAWALRPLGAQGRIGRVAIGLLLVPLLLPNYLAYAGWGLLRAPAGPLGIGDWLGRQPPWVSVAATKALAVWGLTLWAWPLAAMLLAGATRRVPESVLDALRLDTTPGRGRRGGAASASARIRRAVVMAGLVRGGLVLSITVVALVMMGSAVPLHLAQVQAWSIVTWRDLSLTAQPAEVWARSWPPVLVAVGAAWMITSRLVRPAHGGEAPEASPVLYVSPTRGPGRGAVVTSILIWAAAVVVPMALFAGSLREPHRPLSIWTMWRMIAGFWRMSAGAVGSTLLVALGAAGAALVIGLATWAAASIASGRPGRVGRRAAAAGTGVLLAAGLTPGVLVGSATAAAWNRFEDAGVVTGTSLIVVLACVARYGFLAAAIGWWCAAGESRVQRDLRALDGGDSFRGWLAAGLRAPGGGTAILAGAALGVGVLAFHEVEAAVLLQPPGVESFPRLVLDALHYARDERVGAAAISLLGAGIAAAFVTGYLLSPVLAWRNGDRQAVERGGSKPSPPLPVGW